MPKPTSAKKPPKNLFSQKRKHLRYKPELGTVAMISSALHGAFKAEFSALILDEAFQGCHLVMPLTESFKVGSVFRVKLPELNPMEAEVRWRTLLDDRVMRLGIMFRE